MDDMDAVFRTPATGVRQLNHPYLLAKLGRDQGYPQAIGYDPTTPIPATPTDGFTFAANALARAPGGKHRNIDWDVEEVMTGASRADWLRYRALWFSLLNQGFKRVGTANSDSHSLSIERIGYPRNLVWGGHDQGTFDPDSFDADVRAGHLEGTNGPVLDVTIDDGAGKIYRPDMAPITVERERDAEDLRHRRALDPGDGGARIRQRRARAHLRPLVSLPEQRPVRHDVPHRGRQLAARDVAPRQGGRLAGRRGRAAPGHAPRHRRRRSARSAGRRPAGRPALDDPRFNLQAIAPGVWPTAFSNPFFLDLDGGGWTAPGLP